MSDLLVRLYDLPHFQAPREGGFCVQGRHRIHTDGQKADRPLRGQRQRLSKCGQENRARRAERAAESSVWLTGSTVRTRLTVSTDVPLRCATSPTENPALSST